MPYDTAPASALKAGITHRKIRYVVSSEGMTTARFESGEMPGGQMRAEYEEDLHAELGYRLSGRREVAQREWFSLRGDPNEVAPTPKAFKKLVARLRTAAWRKVPGNLERLSAWRKTPASRAVDRLACKARYWRTSAKKHKRVPHLCGICRQSGHNRRRHQ